MNTKFGFVISAAPPSESVRWGLLAEKLGFDSVWLPDHFVDLDGARVDPWTVLAGIGAQTKRILLSTAVTDAYRCHPTKTAHIVASLDELSGGRAQLGIGAGEMMNLTPFGFVWEKPKERVERLREAIKVIRLLWASSEKNRVTFKGKYYHLEEAWLNQGPQKDHIPKIYVGTMSYSKESLMMKVAGELGDGWFPYIHAPETYKKGLAVFKEIASESGRKTKELDSAVWIFVALSDDPQVLEAAINSGKVMLFGSRNVIEDMGYKMPRLYDFPNFQNLVVSQKMKDLVTEGCQMIPEEAVRKCIAIGDSNDCIELIDKFVKVGATHIIFRDLTLKVDSTLKQLKEKVIPYFRGSNF
jgi:alkanesulfonate monooxygenase SsuD/methylene tetrahydromethanopterin reductase-like flavin-dependent oxidoreductase (luciferase family)